MMPIGRSASSELEGLSHIRLKKQSLNGKISLTIPQSQFKVDSLIHHAHTTTRSILLVDASCSIASVK